MTATPGMFTITVKDEQTDSLVSEGTVNVYDDNDGLLDSYSLASVNPKTYVGDLGESVKIIVEGMATRGWTKAGVSGYPALAGNEFLIWLDGVEEDQSSGGGE